MANTAPRINPSSTEASSTPQLSVNNRVVQLSGTPIPIHVGEPSQVFYVHENVICSRTFFNNALKKHDWKEKLERRVELREDEPEIFELYLQGIYFGLLPLKGNYDPLFDLLAKAYVFGDKIQDSGFKDTILDHFIFLSNKKDDNGALWIPDFTAVNIIYGNTLQGSKARQYLIDVYTYCAVDWMKKEGMNLPKEFLVDLSAAHSDIRVNKSWNVQRAGGNNNCDYHEHEVGFLCAWKKNMQYIS